MEARWEEAIALKFHVSCIMNLKCQNLEEREGRVGVGRGRDGTVIVRPPPSSFHIYIRDRQEQKVAPHVIILTGFLNTASTVMLLGPFTFLMLR